MTAVALIQRSRRVGLGYSEIARRTGLDRTTVARILRQPGRAIADNLTQVRQAIEAEERALFDHLQQLHGQPAPRLWGTLSVPHMPTATPATGAAP